MTNKPSTEAIEQVISCADACTEASKVEIKQARAELAALVAERDRLESFARKTICSYCGYITEVAEADVELKRQAALEHILSCDKRPENQLIDCGIAQEKELLALRAENQKLREHLP